MSESILILVGAILALVGAAFVISAIVNQRKARAAESWPIIPGKVLRTEIREHVRRNNGVVTRTYEPVIHYQYNLMGTAYESKRLSFGSAQMKHEQATQITEQYSEGSTVNVHYDPSKPEKSVLEPAARSNKTLLASGIIFFVMGAILALLQIVRSAPR
jgi:hypothetical protein